MNFGALLSSKTLLFRISFSSASLAAQSPRRAISRFSTSSSTGYCAGYPVSVWWNFDNCKVPAGANVSKLTQTITAAVSNNGIEGPITITAFGDVLLLSREKQEALSAAGIILTHVPRDGNNSANRSLIVDLLFWVCQNPPPAHLLIITSNGDLSRELHRLRMRNYNILLACNESAPTVLCSAATLRWDWTALVKGEDVTTKHYNQPPRNSWYGHYNAPLLDPFVTMDQSNNAITEESSDSNSDCETLPIPEEVVNKIRTVLLSFPKGASTTTLRAELAKGEVPIDRNYYGYKKFSQFLMSMPDIFQVHPSADGQYLVHAAVSDISDQSLTDKESDNAASSNPNSESQVTNIAVDPSADGQYLVHAAVSDVSDQSLTAKESDNAASSKPNSDSQVTNTAVDPSADGQYLVHAAVFDVSDQSLTHKESDNAASSKPNSDWQVTNIAVDPERDDRQNTYTDNDASSKPNLDEHVTRIAVTDSDEHIKEESQEEAVGVTDDSSKDTEFVQKLKMSWFGSSATDSADTHNDKHVTKIAVTDSDEHIKEESQEEAVKVTDDSSKDTEFVQKLKMLWFGSSATDSADTHNDKHVSEEGVNKGIEPSSQISHSKEANTSLGFLDRIKKWFFESREEEGNDEEKESREIFADESFWRNVESFINSPRGYAVVTHSRTREVLARNMQKEGPSWLRRLSESNMLHVVDLLISEKKWIVLNSSETLPFGVILKSQPQDVDKRPKNVSHAGVSVARISDKESQQRSKSDVFEDCQKLVKKIVAENPGGYSLSCFRMDFLKQYGYHLDIRKLGHRRLQSLIQLTPGARVKSGFIVPSTLLSSDSGQSGKCPKEDGSDTFFEELGPISKVDLMTAKVPEYEPSVSEDEETDSERKEREESPQGDDKGSSLLQILDLWEGSRCKTKKKEDIDEMKQVHVGGSHGKRKPTRTYSFVANSDSEGVSEKGKNIDGIIRLLEKSDESRARG